jgi:4-hydroxy-tetrahydrodipicolinate synthase
VKELVLRGLYPATVTPFADDNSVDTASLERHLDYTFASEGVQGICVNGHLGEILQLSSEERADVAERAVRLKRDGQVVIAGVEGQRVADLVNDGLRAREAGADALLVLPPVDVRPYRRLSRNSESVLYFFRELDEQVGLPMIVHQYPDFSQTAYSNEVLRGLVELEHVVAIKAASVSTTRYNEVWDEFRDDVSVLAATDAPALLGMLLHGGHGALIGIGAIEPSVWATVIHEALDGDANKASDIFNKVCLPLMETVFDNQEPTGPVSEAGATKEALVQLGQLTSSRVRPPAVGVDDELRARIGDSLRRAGLLQPADIAV